MPKNPYLNKNILIIGSSFGIGEALCRAFDQCGANLMMVARSTSKLAMLHSQLHGNHRIFTCDVSQIESIEQCAKTIQTQCPTIDIVIYCVGVYQPMNINNYDADKAGEIMTINLLGFMNFMSVFLPQFKQQTIHHLAVISSLAGYFGMPNSLVYGASKAALSHLTESLYYELKPYRTKVQLINPGFVKTRLTAQNTFPMPGLMSSEKAAKLILRKLPTSSFEITFPWTFATVMKLCHYLPFRLRYYLLNAIT